METIPTVIACCCNDEDVVLATVFNGLGKNRICGCSLVPFATTDVDDVGTGINGLVNGPGQIDLGKGVPNVVRKYWYNQATAAWGNATDKTIRVMLTQDDTGNVCTVTRHGPISRLISDQSWELGQISTDKTGMGTVHGTIQDGNTDVGVTFGLGPKAIDPKKGETLGEHHRWT
jgi:hypothetical protein